MDFEARIREWVEAVDGDLITPIEAQRLVEDARANAADELNTWLHENAAVFVCYRMGQLNRRERAIGLQRRSSRAFAKAAEDDDTEALVSFLDVRYRIAANTERLLREMVYDDLDYAAGDYEQRSASNGFEAAFLRVVQRKLPKDNSKSVGDLFTDTALERIRRREAA